MKNIHTLQKNVLNQLGVDHYGKTPTQIKIEEYLINKNIYITSNEEIKEGQNYIGDGFSGKNKFKWHKSQVETYPKIEKDVIVLTTDQDLIKDGVQTIGDGFLEWFVKNPGCDEVEVKKDVTDWVMHGYKIIIPQETLEEEHVDILEVGQIPVKKEREIVFELNNNETLEDINTIYHQTSYGNLIKELTEHEALEKAAYKLFSTMPSEISTSTAKNKAMELARWQAARLYDVEEVYSIVRMCLGMKESGKTDIEIGECLERYKKK
jgi:hypothetical protein